MDFSEKIWFRAELRSEAALRTAWHRCNICMSPCGLKRWDVPLNQEYLFNKQVLFLDGMRCDLKGGATPPPMPRYAFINGATLDAQ